MRRASVRSYSGPLTSSSSSLSLDSSSVVVDDVVFRIPLVGAELTLGVGVSEENDTDDPDDCEDLLFPFFFALLLLAPGDWTTAEEL